LANWYILFAFVVTLFCAATGWAFFDLNAKSSAQVLLITAVIMYVAVPLFLFVLSRGLNALVRAEESRRHKRGY